MALVWPEFAASCQKRAHVYRPGTRLTRACTDPCKLGREVYPARYTSAASLHGPVKLGLDVYRCRIATMIAIAQGHVVRRVA